ncbi:YhcH/YjgK/YiaL family protein [Paenibacillus sp. IB182496]|uniref:YhcH/YjgK/YiaL family protein n=1 Tax=Paenibacillus sabuli TaxID=2772509 RepID=A0A927GQR0_9BACL|nr:YhcH/YjgK/YiaL family protein [Paenibacillus sabuli]MBD2844155.1 YhcH/YjgK/YiaL family protein [Paenibacillus sabuli]
MIIDRIKDRIYASVFEYETVAPDEMKWESHRAYIDLHVPLLGEECIFWAPVEELASVVDYSPDNDRESDAGTVHVLFSCGWSQG